ncbi:MAG TPA: hypothetical protein VKG92_01395, partial [Flavobacteriales bacterium]|nr:hypothetical protein [Flavobacteriales bacterium]
MTCAPAAEEHHGFRIRRYPQACSIRQAEFQGLNVDPVPRIHRFSPAPAHLAHEHVVMTCRIEEPDPFGPTTEDRDALDGRFVTHHRERNEGVFGTHRVGQGVDLGIAHVKNLGVLPVRAPNRYPLGKGMIERVGCSRCIVAQGFQNGHQMRDIREGKKHLPQLDPGAGRFQYHVLRAAAQFEERISESRIEGTVRAFGVKEKSEALIVIEEFPRLTVPAGWRQATGLRDAFSVFPGELSRSLIDRHALHSAYHFRKSKVGGCHVEL